MFIAHTGYLELFDLVVKHILPGMGLFFYFVLHFNCKFATSKKEFTINQSDNSWSYADIKFNKVTIYKLAQEHKEIGDDKKANCLIVVNMTVKANKDIEIFPDQGTISTNNGLQGDTTYTADFGDSIDSGVTRTGDVTIPLDGVKNISDLKKLRYKFDGGAKDDNDESDDAFKFIDVQINLN